MKLDVIDGSSPLIPCKDGNLRIFMEQIKNGHCKDIQLGDFFWSQTGCSFDVLEEFMVSNVLVYFGNGLKFQIALCMTLKYLDLLTELNLNTVNIVF